MIYILQVVYAAFGMGSAILDYFIIKAFIPDVHQSVYIYMCEYSEIMELVFIIVDLAIGAFVEMAQKWTAKAKKAWEDTVLVFFSLTCVEALFRIFGATIMGIHVHPGQLDFMGLFVVILLMYFLLKFCIMLALTFGLYEAIQVKKISLPSLPYLPIQAYIPRY